MSKKIKQLNNFADNLKSWPGYPPNNQISYPVIFTSHLISRLGILPLIFMVANYF